MNGIVGIMPQWLSNVMNGLHGMKGVFISGVGLAMGGLLAAPGSAARLPHRRNPSVPGADVWLFDLDNTLYPPDTGLMEAISERINFFIERFLNLPPQLAQEVREAYYGAYGSSIHGVLKHCKVDAEQLLKFIHKLPLEDYLRPDPALRDLIDSLHGAKYIFTNATREYALRALQALGIDACFEDIFDIHFAGLQGKPNPIAYQRVMRAIGQSGGPCWLVEDSLANLLVAKAYGCRTILLPAPRDAAEDRVDFVIHDLTELRGISRRALKSRPPAEGRRGQ